MYICPHRFKYANNNFIVPLVDKKLKTVDDLLSMCIPVFDLMTPLTNGHH